MARRSEPSPDDGAGTSFAGSPARDEGGSEHRERQRGERQAGLQCVVLQHHLQVDRQGDHRAAQGDLLHQLSRDAQPEQLRREQIRVDQRRLSLALAAHEPPGEQGQGDDADCQQGGNGLATLLPHEDAQHDAAHGEHREHRTDDVDAPGSCVRHVADELEAGEHDPDDDHLEAECHAIRQKRGDEATEQRTDRSGDRSRGPDQGVGLALRNSFEVAVDEGLHGREEERRSEAADHRPEDEDRDHALGECHCKSSDRIGEQTQRVCPLAPEEVADLASDQDERRRDQGFDRDGRLDAAHGRVEVGDDG